MSAFTTRAPALANTARSSLRSAFRSHGCSGRVHGFKGASDAASYQQSRRFEQMTAYCTADTQRKAYIITSFMLTLICGWGTGVQMLKTAKLAW